MATLQLCLVIVTVIQATSSQSTYDVIQQDSDVSSCEGTQQVLIQLVRAVSRIETTMSQLQRDVAELKAVSQQTTVTGMPEAIHNHSVKTIIL